MKVVDPTIRFDQLPPMVGVAILVTLINTEDKTDLFMFYGRYIHHMTLEDLADRLQISKQRVSVRLNNLHLTIRRNYEKIMCSTSRSYVVSTISPDEGFRLSDG